MNFCIVNNSQMSMGDEQVSGENWQRRPSHLAELLQRTRQLLTGDVEEMLSVRSLFIFYFLLHSIA